MLPQAQLIDWVLKAVMGLVSIFVFLLGRDVKRSEDAIAGNMNRVHSELALELQLRDQRLDAIEQRLDRAGQKSSDEASRIMTKAADLEHRLTILETHHDDR